MKRALLPSFDPLPHALSTRGLLALVAVVVMGTAVTVHRYMESSASSPHRPAGESRFDRPSEVRAAPRDAPTAPARSGGMSTRTRGSVSGSWSGTCANEPCPRQEPEASGPAHVTAPSQFVPPGSASGS